MNKCLMCDMMIDGPLTPAGLCTACTNTRQYGYSGKPPIQSGNENRSNSADGQSDEQPLDKLKRFGLIALGFFSGYVQWTDYTSTSTGTVIKQVCCEQCGDVYFYQVTRYGLGFAPGRWFKDDDQAASQQSQDKADSSLQKQLKEGVDAVPCPACGWYQPNMIPLLRSMYHSWIWGMGFAALLSVPLVFGFVLVKNRFIDGLPGFHKPPVDWTTPLRIAGGLVLFGIASMVFRYIIARRHDPNSPENLKLSDRIGSKRALRTQDLQSLSDGNQGNGDIS